MLILGLAGAPGVGKNMIADYLEQRYGFVQFAFSDALYREVAEAYGLETEDLLRDRGTKDEPQERLALRGCKDKEFVRIATEQLDILSRRHRTDLLLYPVGVGLSPRQVLQWWGTEYRRHQDKDYWIHKAKNFIVGLRSLAPYPEHKPQFFVETGTRFENERAFIHSYSGNIWHVRRDIIGPMNAHASNTPLPVLEGEREIWNNDTVERLQFAVDLMLTTAARFVRAEPMESECPPIV